MTRIRAIATVLAAVTVLLAASCGTTPPTDVASVDEPTVDSTAEPLQDLPTTDPTVTEPPTTDASTTEPSTATSTTGRQRWTNTRDVDEPGTTVTTESSTTEPATTWPPTTIPTETTEDPPPVTNPPEKFRCMIIYGTLVPGYEKDVPVYRTDVQPFEQIATIHLPGEIWTPAEAEDLCA